MDRDIETPDRNAADRDPGEGHPDPREANRSQMVSRQGRSYIGRDYAYQISLEQRQTMYEIGRFRTIATDDLRSQRYPGRDGDMRRDLRSLVEQGLVQRRTVLTGARRQKLTVVVLSRRGKDVLEREPQAHSGQRLYAGFVKPAEVAHDAAIYRMYQAESRQIAKQHGRVRRVILDYELKQKIYAPLAKARALPPLEFAKRQADVARENGLPVLQGRIPLPDLRIEYETKDGDIEHVDLELATHHYHGSQLATKAAAGFKMYSPADSAGHLRAVLEDREITAAILSL
jgi:hypothetical protein